MKVLQLGVTGAAVRQWQTFLRGQGFDLNATGTFDDATEAATRSFQVKHKLDVDGRVGNQTFGKAGMLGLELVDQTSSVPGFPPKPDFAPLASNAERQALFGPLKFRPAPVPGNPEAIAITNGWDGDNLVKVNIPELVGIKGAPASGNVFMHRRAAAPMQALWKAWSRKGLIDRIVSYDGAYNPRFIRGGAAKQILSNHAFGTAFDINARFNPLGAEPAGPTQPGCLLELVPLANQFGFYWGGHFTRRDGMHFELAVVA